MDDDLATKIFRLCKQVGREGHSATGRATGPLAAHVGDVYLDGLDLQPVGPCPDLGFEQFAGERCHKGLRRSEAMTAGVSSHEPILRSDSTMSST